MDDPVEALDWQGETVRCRDCRHRPLRKQGLCIKGRSCIRDRRARRIDDFLKKNIVLANEYLDHPYFEVRAIAARYANIFKLPALFDDPEVDVRVAAVLRLHDAKIARLVNDPEPKVRMAVATRLKLGPELIAMLSDREYTVRHAVVRRLPPDLLALAMYDADVDIRRTVARRIAPCELIKMAVDPEPHVRREVAERLAPEKLTLFARDRDIRVRYVAAERATLQGVVDFARDADALVRELVQTRLAESSTDAAHPHSQELEQ